MNSVSWMVYLAEVIGKIIHPFGIVAIGYWMIVVFAFGIQAITNHDEDYYRSGIEKKTFAYSFVKKRFVFLWLFCTIMAIIIPSSTTIYMIAASEMGQRVIENPQAQEMFAALYDKIMEGLTND